MDWYYEEMKDELEYEELYEHYKNNNLYFTTLEGIEYSVKLMSDEAIQKGLEVLYSTRINNNIINWILVMNIILKSRV